KPPNHKRVYRVMKVHGLLLNRHVGRDERRQDGRMPVDERNGGGGSDGFEMGAFNGEREAVALRPACWRRDAAGGVATTDRVPGRSRPQGNISAVVVSAIAMSP